MTRDEVVARLACIVNESSSLLLDVLTNPVVAITVREDCPPAMPCSPSDGEMTMSRLKSVFGSPRSNPNKSAGPKGAPASFTITDVGNGNYKVLGTDGAGFTSDLGPGVTIAVSDTGSPAGCATSTLVPGTTDQFNEAGAAPGSNVVTITATWADGSVGPFTTTATFTVTVSATTGITVTPAP